MSRSLVRTFCFTLVVLSQMAGDASAQPITGKKDDRAFEVAPATDEFGLAVSMPLPLLYLEKEAVRTDLKITKEQAQRIEVLVSPWSDTAKNRVGAWTDIAKLRENLGAGMHAEVNRILTAEQQKRLTQIIWRHREKEFGLPAVINALANELNFTEEQRERFDRLRAKRAEIVLEQVTADERLSAIRREIHDANNDYVEKVQQLLTAAQQTKWADLLGEPFAADIKLNPPKLLSVAFHRNLYLEQFFFQNYSFEPDFLGSESVQKELRMEDDQVRKVKEFWVEWTQRVEDEMKDRIKNATPTREATLGAIVIQNGFVADNLQKLLKPNQLARFRSIMIQHRMAISGPTSAYFYPGAAQEAKITDAQVEQIRKGAKLNDVLIKAQIENMSTVIGAPFAGSVKFDSRELIVTYGAVAKSDPAIDVRMVDFKSKVIAHYMLAKQGPMRLTDTQVSRLKEIADEAPKIREILHKELSSLPPPTTHGARILPEARAVQQYKQATLDRCLDVLDDKQRSQFGNELRKMHGEYQ